MLRTGLGMASVGLFVVGLLAGCGADPGNSGEDAQASETLVSGTGEAPETNETEEFEPEVGDEDLDPLWFLSHADPYGDASVDEIIVEKSLTSVRITVPSNFLTTLSEEEIASYSIEAGYPTPEINPDRSISYVLSPRRHQQILGGMKANLEETLREAIEANPLVFSEITVDRDVTKFEVEANKAAFESSPEAFWISFTLGLSGVFYQVISGVSVDDRNVVIEFKDSVTQEVFDTQVWPGEG